MLEPNEMLTRDEQVAEAQREVEMARAEVADRLSTVAENSTAKLKQVVNDAKPILIGIAALGALALTVKIVKSAVSARQSRFVWQPPVRERSVIGGIVRSALLSAGSAAASRFAQRALVKWTSSDDKWTSPTTSLSTTTSTLPTWSTR